MGHGNGHNAGEVTGSAVWHVRWRPQEELDNVST